MLVPTPKQIKLEMVDRGTCEVTAKAAKRVVMNMHIEPILPGRNYTVRDGRGCSKARLASLENDVIGICRDTQGVALGCDVLALQAVENTGPMAVSKRNHCLTKKSALCRLRPDNAA